MTLLLRRAINDEKSGKKVLPGGRGGRRKGGSWRIVLLGQTDCLDAFTTNVVSLLSFEAMGFCNMSMYSKKIYSYLALSFVANRRDVQVSSIAHRPFQFELVLFGYL